MRSSSTPGTPSPSPGRTATTPSRRSASPSTTSARRTARRTAPSARSPSSCSGACAGERWRWHLAAGAGLRIGEQFQLRADDIVEHRGHLLVRVDWQWSTGPGRRARPKTRKRRVVPVPPVRLDGYPLEDALRERARIARAEQAAGANPEGLLFPAPEGGMWWSSNLNELLVAAQKAAGWHHVVVPEQRRLRSGRSATVLVTQMQHPWHSLRHRFARDMIDGLGLSPARLMAIGGWDSLEVLSTRYYRSASEHWDSAVGLVFAAGTSSEPDHWAAAGAAHDPGRPTSALGGAPARSARPAIGHASGVGGRRGTPSPGGPRSPRRNYG